MADIDDLKPGDEVRRADRRGGRASARRSLGDAPAAPARSARSRTAPASPRTSCSRRNLFYICLNVGEVAIMALPLTLIVITGEIDLSVASMLGLTGVLMAELFKHGWPIWPAMLAAVALGMILGAFNGFLVTRLGLPSLAVTIGTLTLYRGIAQGILPTDTIGGFPTSPHEHRRHPDPRHAHPVLDRVLRGARRHLRRRSARDAARPRDLRDRRRPGSGLLRRHSRQADQVLAVRPLRDAVRVRRRSLDAPLRLGPLRRRHRARSSTSSRSSCSAASRSSAAAAPSPASSWPSPSSARFRRR